MKAFILGTVFGIVVATVGFSGIARILDHGIQKTKDIATDRKSTRLNSSHIPLSRMPSSA